MQVGFGGAKKNFSVISRNLTRGNKYLSFINQYHHQDIFLSDKIASWVRRGCISTIVNKKRRIL
jgi:hypothetical protein